MTTLADAKTKEVDTGIREALETALARGALPGEREGFDEAALTAAALFVGRTANGRLAGQPAIAIETLGEGANGRFMRVALINDDMPFLVDSIANALDASDISTLRELQAIGRGHIAGGGGTDDMRALAAVLRDASAPLGERTRQRRRGGGAGDAWGDARRRG